MRFELQQTLVGPAECGTGGSEFVGGGCRTWRGRSLRRVEPFDSPQDDLAFGCAFRKDEIVIPDDAFQPISIRKRTEW